MNRLLTYNEENIHKQKTLQQSAAASGALGAVKTHATQKGASGPGTREAGAGTRGSRKDGTRGTKRGREEVIIFFAFLTSWLTSNRRTRVTRSQILSSVSLRRSKCF
jgi:hypothetical protein